ncbi:MAG: two-component regulator propeller domain-containing protein [Calditrichia bacterium]
MGNAAPDIQFRHITIDDGLSQNAIFAILQDQKGFMWFGTGDGLNRYDGYDFTVYRYDPLDSTSLSGNHITTVFEDHLGRMWIGTLDAGLNLFHRGTDSFLRFSLPSQLTQTPIARQITAIAEDSSGNIWIGTERNGLFCIAAQDSLSPPGPNPRQFFHIAGAANSLSSNSIRALFVDSRGSLWIGTDKRLDKLNTEMDPAAFEHYIIAVKNPGAPVSPADSGIASIYEDNRGRFWLGTAGGIGRLNRSDGSLTFYPHPYEVFRRGRGEITSMVEDSDGKLWLATPGQLMRFDPEKTTYDYFRHDPFDNKSISYNGVSSLFRDRSDILWFGTPGAGLNLYDLKAGRFSTLVEKPNSSSRISGFSVQSVFVDNTGIVWISTDLLYRWDRKTGKLKSFESSSNRPDDFGNTAVFSILQTAGGEMWCATAEGLYCYHPGSGKIRLYKFNPADTAGLRQKGVFAVFEDRNKTIWIASKNYLSRLDDAENGRFRHFRYNPAPPQNRIVRPVIYQDGTGLFWMGTTDGLLRFDPVTGSFNAYRDNPSQPSSLGSNSVKSICPDPAQPDRFLWLGTDGGGLNRFDVQTKTFTHFTEKNGLPGNVVNGILPDNAGNLWMSTNKGLSRFNSGTGKFKNYDVWDGLQSNEFNTGACFRSTNGEMFFGGIKGLNYFYPEKVKANPHIPEIAITGFKLRNHRVSYQTKPILLKKDISATDHLVLSYRDDVITFEFAALDFTAPEKNQYAYKLENFDPDWIKTDGDRSATYTHLPPGDYIFRVKGSNNDGVWNELGTSLSLTVTPPWWGTWWAYALYVMAILIALYGIRRYELNRIRLKNSLRIGQIEADKLKELDRLRTRFFANISHEFRTPLTLILGQIDNVISSNIGTKEKGKLQIAMHNSRRLLELINQLLDLSKLEAGSLQLKAECHNLVSFASGLFYSFESLAGQKKISLHFHTQQSEIAVLFEPDKMEKVFYNLISNAVKFTPAGGNVTMSINLPPAPPPFSREERLTPEMRPGAMLEIRVRDSGIGIPADQLPHIFDRFYQADSSHSRHQEGTGIGLALTKELVELHQGRIEVRSEEGTGTEFIIYLPMSEVPLEKKDERKISSKYSEQGFLRSGNPALVNNQQPEPAMQMAAGNRREIILILEDNPDVRAYISEQLENDYRIIEAANGDEGIQQAQIYIPDLIITDVMMPQIDGYEFCRQIRQDEKTSHIPIIMLTAKAALDDRIEGLETGVDAYLTKPFSAKELQVRVRNLILQRAQLRNRFSKVPIIKPSDISGTSVDQNFLQKVLNMVNDNLAEEGFSIDKLADKMNMSVSQLNRKLHALIGQAPGQLVRSMRLQRAADLLKQNTGTVAEICYRLGFSDQANFSRAFKKQFGMAPSEFRRAGK